MKKISLAPAMAITLMALAACNKLNENPQGSLTAGNFYKTQSDAVAAVTAVDSTLTTDVNNDFPLYGPNLNPVGDNPSQNHVYSPSNTNPHVRAVGPSTYVTNHHHE